ncbi:MAG: glycosyltransferase, partial [Clostridiales bacterium]|nr:glycosyltransferase [Clostridiales bacterium]
MRNVLYLINHAGRAGTERYVLSLVEAAPAHGWRPHFAYNEGGALSERIAALRVPSERIEMRGPFDLRAARALGAYCRSARIDVVHTSFLRENYIALLARRFFCPRAEVVYTNHVMLANPWPIKAANRLMTRGNRRIIAVCGAARERLVKNGNDARKIAVIHNAVDPAEWRPGDGHAATRAAARARHAIAGGATVFLCASRFSPEKGHRFLIEAFALLAGGGGNANGADGASASNGADNANGAGEAGVADEAGTAGAAGGAGAADRAVRASASNGAGNANGAGAASVAKAKGAGAADRVARASASNGADNANGAEGAGMADEVGAADGASVAKANGASAAGGAGSRACLLLAGDGPLLGEMKALAASLGLGERVRFAGHV